LAINSTNGGGAAVQITSWAQNEASAGSQAQGNGTDEVVFANPMTTNNGNIDAAFGHVGRCVVKNRGLGDEEVRYILSSTAGTGTTVIAVVTEPWTDAPVATDTLEVCYIIQDAATVGGVGLVNKTNDDYDLSKFFTVQTGGGFFLLNGATMVTQGAGSTTVAEITSESGGWFQVGVKQFGTGVRGGRISLAAGTSPVDGDWGIEIEAGAIGNFYSVDVKGGVSYHSIFAGTCEILDSKFFKCIYNADFSGVITMTNAVVEGTGLTTDQVTCDESTDVQSMVFGNADGFTDDASATVETIVLKDVDWSGLSKHVETQHANKTFQVLDPYNFEPVITDQSELLFTAAGLVDELNSFTASTKEPDGTAAVGSKVFVGEHLVSDTIVAELTSDSNGVVSSDILYRTFRDNATTVTRVTYGTWATKVYEYGKTPLVAAIDYSVRAVENQFAMIDDPDVTAASGAAAITAGSGIVFVRHGTGETDTRPMKVIRVDGIVSAPTYGDTIDDNAGGTKSGDVIDFVDRGGGVFDIVLENWSGVEFSDNDVLDLNAAAWDSGAVLADVAGFYREVTWFAGELLADNATTTIYDYQIGRAAEAVAGIEIKAVIQSVEGERALPILGNGAKIFRSERNVNHSEGWWIGRVSDLSNLSSLEMDDGTAWTPPSVVTLTFTGIPSGLEARIKRGSLSIAADANVTSGSYIYTYNYVAGEKVTATFGGVGTSGTAYERVTLEIDLTNSDQTIPLDFNINDSYVPL
jgi:hypothetical protein